MKQKILLIEDNRFFAEFLKNEIERSLPWIVVDIVQSKAEFDRIDERQLMGYKYVIADLFLKDCIDCGLVDQMIALDVPVIVITASSDVKLLKKYLQKRIVDFIIKGDSAQAGAIEQKLAILEYLSQNKILILEDSSTYQRYLERFFSIYYPYSKILFAKEVSEAREIVSANDGIRLVLCDYHLAGKEDGLDFVRWARSLFKHEEMAILALTSDEDPIVMSRFLKAGANDYITKDFHNSELVSRIDNSIRIMLMFEKVKELSVTDPLTGCYNRRYLYDMGPKMLGMMKRLQKPVSGVMFDLDHFKKINDTYGHEAGDAVLVDFSKRVREILRKEDILVRMGGEEFFVLFANCMKEDAKKIVDERLRPLLECVAVDGHMICYNFSAGIAQGYDLEALLKEADEKLYKAKEQRGVSVA